MDKFKSLLAGRDLFLVCWRNNAQERRLEDGVPGLEELGGVPQLGVAVEDDEGVRQLRDEVQGAHGVEDGRPLGR